VKSLRKEVPYAFMLRPEAKEMAFKKLTPFRH